MSHEEAKNELTILQLELDEKQTPVDNVGDLMLIDSVDEDANISI